MTSLFLLSTLAAVASAHVQINYPPGEWNRDAQSTGAFCGGGQSSGAYAWGLQNAFISLSGDEGETITVMWAQGNSTSAPPTVSSTSDFGTTLLANATFPSSGNFCFNVSIPTQQSGVLSTLYVQAAGAGNNVSACADVAAIPNLSIASSPVIADGQEVLDPSTGQSVSYYEYYCSNSTILALDTCSCHCHGTSEHCDAECSPERIEQAKTQCAAGESSTSSATSVSASSSATATAGSEGAAASASPSTPASGASRLQLAGWSSLVLGGAVAFLT